MSETKTFVVPDNKKKKKNNLNTMKKMNGSFGGDMWNNPLTKC